MDSYPSDEYKVYQGKDYVRDVEGAYTAHSRFGDEPEEEFESDVVLGGGLLKKLFDLGVESRGVERVPEEERDNRFWLNSLLFWFSVNTVLTTIPIGMLAQEYYSLTFAHALVCIICFGVLGAAATSFVAILGPITGLRTMIIARYTAGYVGGCLYSVLNILTQLGFSVIAVILGGQTLASINPGTLPLTVGIVIIGLLSFIPCFIGYSFVHRYERYAWLVTFFIMCCLWGLGGKAGFDIHAQEPEEPTGADLAAGVLNFGGIIFSSYVGWAPVCADYNCHLPSNSSSVKIYLLTFFGLWIPITFCTILGAALMTIQDPAYTGAFENLGSGGLIAHVLTPWGGGGKFLLVLLGVMVFSNNVVNTYSAALSIQALGGPFSEVPRAFWTLVIFAAYTFTGVFGREHFSEILSNFLAILGYFIAFFLTTLAWEHFYFRRPSGPLGGYDLTAYDSPTRLPLGVAGILAVVFGVMGAVLGMAEVYYTGVIAKKIGNGGDLGFELSAAFSTISYPIFRTIEIKLVGR